jgi:hypothetical protein
VEGEEVLFPGEELSPLPQPDKKKRKMQKAMNQTGNFILSFTLLITEPSKPATILR